MHLTSLQAVARGLLAAARDPRRLARLSQPDPDDIERAHRETVVRTLGGVPRTVPFEKLLHASAKSLDAYSFLDGTSTVLDLILLRSLAARYGARRYLEIGTFRGESAVAVADMGVDVSTLSLSDADLVAMQVEPSLVAAHRTISAGHPRVHHLFGDSRSCDLSGFEDAADLIFIDGSHARADVATDTRRCWGLRAGPRAVVVWHDAFLTPLEPRWEVLAGIADGLPEGHRRGLVHVSNTLAVAWLPDAAMLPTVDRTCVPRVLFSVTVDSRPAFGPTPGDLPEVQDGHAQEGRDRTGSPLPAGEPAACSTTLEAGM